MNPLTLSQLSSICFDVATGVYPYNFPLREYFQILFDYGVRTNEPFQINRWSTQGFDAVLNPLKGNNPRVLEGLGFLYVDFFNCIQTQSVPFAGLRISQAYNLFKKVVPVSPITTEEKVIDMYIFRYHFVKQLAANGNSPSQIASVMGYTSTQAVSNYIGQTLYGN